MKIRNSLFLEVGFLIFLSVLGYKLYLLPVLANPSKIILYSDDAIYAMLAKKALEGGPWAIFNLTWAPLFPWLIATFHKLFATPLEEGGLLITSASVVLRIIPAYLIARLLWGRLEAAVAAIILMGVPFITISFQTPLAETLGSLIILWGIYFSIKALQSKKIIFYIFSGVFWALSYLTRQEGWIYIIPLLILTQKNLRLVLISILAFIIISFPYLSFIKNVYGSWTLNPRFGIHLVLPGSYFSLAEEDGRLLTPAYIYWSGDPQSYSSPFWHPKLKNVVAGVTQKGVYKMLKGLGDYIPFFWSNIPRLFVIGTLGIFLTFFILTKKSKGQILLNLLPFIFLVVLVDIVFRIYGFYISSQLKNIKEIFYVHTIRDNLYTFYLILFDLVVLTVTTATIFFAENFSKLRTNLYFHRVALFPLLAIGFGIAPLIFHNVQPRFVITLACILCLYAAYFIVAISKVFIKHLNALAILTGVVLTLYVAKPLYAESVYVENAKYYNPFAERIRKNPGLAILSDHGPGAKVADYYEAPAFYAKGEVVYLPYDGDKITVETTLKYLAQERPDYVVAVRYEGIYVHSNLEPFYNPKNKIAGWYVIYSDPSEDLIDINDYNRTAIIVWKKT